ncbi:uncharacterized protein LOC125646770 isoform X1 [Ostrea edulis]|uniref:uncharacterized protein LOC125646770 isoform X1 n=1 Tax=Ostrea edulis TaxID=37623 RepID=UPI0024AEDA3D|nr:uncharacterized protein LOC125646770 isoform X1 [Ostrea edulis]XP_055995321.1 uncharacterized protein LOC125646770 isoform X1 [Ostrea edulis]
MFWVQYTLILFTVLAAVLLPCLSVQKAVIIEDPCTDGQRYTLGRDGLIVIKADGNKFFTGSCVVTLRAEDPRYQCSKLCFTVDTFKLQVCDLRLAFYDTGVWNYGSSPAAWVGGCGPNQNIQNKKWCSSGSTATIRLENMRGFAVSMVQKYSFYMTAVSICSEDARIPQEQVSEPAFGGSVSVTVIIIIAVLGCVTICTCVVVIFLVWYVKRRTAMERQGTNDYRNHTIHIPESGSGMCTETTHYTNIPQPHTSLPLSYTTQIYYNHTQHKFTTTIHYTNIPQPHTTQVYHYHTLHKYTTTTHNTSLSLPHKYTTTTHNTSLSLPHKYTTTTHKFTTTIHYTNIPQPHTSLPLPYTT